MDCNETKAIVATESKVYQARTVLGIARVGRPKSQIVADELHNESCTLVVTVIQLVKLVNGTVECTLQPYERGSAKQTSSRHAVVCLFPGTCGLSYLGSFYCFRVLMSDLVVVHWYTRGTSVIRCVISVGTSPRRLPDILSARPRRTGSVGAIVEAAAAAASYASPARSFAPVSADPATSTSAR